MWDQGLKTPTLVTALATLAFIVIVRIVVRGCGRS